MPRSFEAIVPPRIIAAVKLMNTCAFKVTVILFWLCLSVGGLLVIEAFLKELISDIPPVSGTLSYDAQHAMDLYFPQETMDGAVLVKSKDHSPFFRFVNRSTCSLEDSIQIDQKDTQHWSVNLWFKANETNALGGGCLTREGLAVELTPFLQNVTQQFGIKYPISKTTVELLLAQAHFLPDTTLCPVSMSSEESHSLTWEWQEFGREIRSSFESRFPGCSTTVLSLNDLPSQALVTNFSYPVNGTNFTFSLNVSIPGGYFWQVAERELMGDALSSSLIAVKVGSCSNGTSMLEGDVDPGAQLVSKHDFGAELQEVTKKAPATMHAKASSVPLMEEAIQTGIKSTMDLSSATMPAALLILAIMVKNIRLVLCTIVNLIACLASAMLFMYPIAKQMTVATVAPSLMVAVALAMSIDYSLFLFQRFQQEMLEGHDVETSVTIMLATSGKIVCVSGFTLLFCFLMMLILPCQLIASMGISAACTVLTAIMVALTLTPALLLTFPRFFGSTKNWGLTRQGCCFCSSPAVSESQRELPQSYDEPISEKRFWPAFGMQVQKLVWPIVLALLFIAIPVGTTSLPKFGHSCGLIPLMPSDATATLALEDLTRSFGVGSIFPTALLLIPPEDATDSEDARSKWLLQVCDALQNIARSINTDHGVPAFSANDFSGPMIMNGTCTSRGEGEWSHAGHPYSATKVSIFYQIDPFSSEGQAWITRLRDAVDQYSSLGTWYVAGAGPIQMDVANKTFAMFPMMITLMMCVVLLLIGVAFCSLVAPVRAVFCLLWMLVVTFGIAIFTFQDGLFAFLNWPQLGTRVTGAMNWMSPCIAFSVLVGLGLDYDIFYSERVIEECKKGIPAAEAAIHALAETANIISAAGIIMVAAFLSLLLSTTPTLNEIALLLIVGVIIDCFVTTKIIVPAVMGLLGRWNFWPRKFPTVEGQGSTVSLSASM